MANYSLYPFVGSPLGLSVTDPGTLHGAQTRAMLQTGPGGAAYARGDGAELVAPIGCTIRVLAASEADAYEQLSAIYEFAAGAMFIAKADPSVDPATAPCRYLQHARALLDDGADVASLAEFAPEPRGGTLYLWQARLTLLPVFPLWTIGPAGTLATYEAARAAGSVLL